MNLELTLTREKFLEDRTIGRLSVGDVVSYWILEDAFREIVGVPVEQWKVPGKTAIPMGRYRLVWHDSPRFGKKLPMLLGVPGYKYVLIHSGNKPEDTEGCLLIGSDFDERNGYITRSRVALTEFLSFIAPMLDDPEDFVWLTVR